MPYPRLLKLDDDTETRLRSYLNEELNRHYMERDPWIQDIEAWQRNYWAEPVTKRATFPFTGASTVVIPLTAITVEAMFARVDRQLFGLKQFVSAGTKNDEWEESARPVEALLDHVLKVDIDIRKPLTSSCLEIIKYGTGVMKTGYERVIKKAIRQIGSEEQEFDVVIKDGPIIESTAIARFLMPFSSINPQTAPWCAEEHSKSPFEIRAFEDSGLFYPGTMETLKSWIQMSAMGGVYGQERRFERDQERMEHKIAVWPKLITWFEFNISFDIDGDGRDEELIINYHRGAQFFMSIRYNHNDDLHRQWRVGVFFPVEHRWTGIGEGKMLDQFQREVTTQHRQRLDNATLANMKMVVIHRSSGYSTREPIFPGKMWEVDNMDFIKELSLSEIHESSFSNEQSTLIYSQQRSGVNELNLGMPQIGTPGTATSDLARMQEGNKKFDLVYANIKKMVDQVIIDTAVNIRQFGIRNIRYYDAVSGGNLAKVFFQQDPSMIRDGLILELAASGQQQNKLQDRTNMIQIAGISQQYVAGKIQLAQLLQQPQIMQMLAIEGMDVADEIMKLIYDTYDLPSAQRLILKLPILDQMLAQLKQATQQVAQQSQLTAGTPSAGTGPIVPIPGTESGPPATNQV